MGMCVRSLMRTTVARDELEEDDEDEVLVLVSAPECLWSPVELGVDNVRLWLASVFTLITFSAWIYDHHSQAKVHTHASSSGE